MNLLQRFTASIKKQQLFSREDKLILAVSGGADSVVLCELCQQAGYRFVIAHCNFQLRGAESDRDEKFVRDLAAKYGVELFVKKFETEKYAQENKLSIQEAAREQRYTWFGELIDELIGKGQWAKGNKEISDEGHQPQTPNSKSESRTFSTNKEFPVLKTVPFAHSPFPIHLLTAHHADDNIETLLMHFLRGTGLKGLTGIPASAGYTRRPLLSFYKEELLEFTRENQLAFVEDSSNLSSKYTRNYLRNEWIPAVEQIYPQVKHNLRDNIERFGSIEKLYKLSVAALKQKLMKQKEKEWQIPVKQLLGYQNKALVYEIISDFGFSEKQVDELIRLGESESGHFIQSPAGTHRIIKHRHWFIIADAVSTEPGIRIIEETDRELVFEKGRLQVSRSKDLQVSANPAIARLDAKYIRFPLLLRKWKTGDYFYPLGMRKKKKISRFLIDGKFSKTEKENTWVLESDQRIVWVAGHRIDDRYKITAATREVIQLHLIPA